MDSKYQNQFKNTNTKTKIDRLKQFSKDLKTRRVSAFISNRQIDVLNNSRKSVKQITRREKLLEYKEQKKKRMEQENKAKKTVFKVTRVPILINEIALPDVKGNDYKHVKSKVNSNLKNRPPQKPIRIIPDNHQFKVPSVVTQINTTKTTSKKNILPPTSIVTRSQIRRQKIEKGGFSESIAMKNSTFFDSMVSESKLSTASSTFRFENLSINSVLTFKDISFINPSPMEKVIKDGVYFERLLNTEIDRLENRCQHWENIVTENTSVIPTEMLDDIDSAIGQTRLLIKKKFEQFRGLTHGKCEKKITPDDLQGFWDMIYMQVENLDKRFSDLEEKQKNNWIEKEKILAMSNNSVKSDVSAVKKRTKVVGPSVGLKEAIAAARRKKIESQSLDNSQSENSEAETNKNIVKIVDSAEFPLKIKSENLNNSKNKVTVETAAAPSNSFSDTTVLTRRKAFAKLKQEKIEDISNSENITPEQDSTIVNSSSYLKPKKRATQSVIYNLLKGKQEKQKVTTPPIILAHEPSTDNQTNEFNAGFFTILSPCKSSIPKNTTPAAIVPHTRKSVLSDTTKTNSGSPGLFMLRASMGAKVSELNVEKTPLGKLTLQETPKSNRVLRSSRLFENAVPDVVADEQTDLISWNTPK